MPPIGMMRPPIMPPNTSGFFMPPVPSGGFSIPNNLQGIPTPGMSRMPIPNMPVPQTTAGPGNSSNENGAQLRTQIKMHPPE